jgi:hypothetical protein
MKRFRRNALFLVILSLGIGSSFLGAQVQSANGSIQGEVTDAKGALVQGAAVVALEAETQTRHEVVTDSQGHFDFPTLQPGHYQVKVSKTGFGTTIQENLSLTVGLTTSLRLVLQVAGAQESVIVNAAPLVDVVTDSSTTTLGETTIATTPVLGRKFEDLLTLTPGVDIVQGPDGDEININGQKGIYNNISLDGGDYNNGFFGDTTGGQRSAVDITLEAVREFQVVASGANAEFGRSGGGVVNVITKSGSNALHGSVFEYQRLQALTADASDGTPLTNFHREQFGGSAGGAIIKDKLFYFGAGEGINENLLRANLSAFNADALGAPGTPATPCPVANPVFGSNISDAAIDANGDCQRQVLVNFLETNYHENDGAPVDHKVHNVALFGRVDYQVNARNLLYTSYNFDWSRNPNQTFDVATYGTTANGTEGPSHIQTSNLNLVTTVSNSALNEAHVTFGHETRPRSPIDASAVPDTAIGFQGGAFRFGQPFFEGPGLSEAFWHVDLKDSFSLVRGKHAIKFGVEALISHNTQVFDGFALGRYIFGDTVGFLHFATSASQGAAYGPNVQQCPNGTWSTTCTGGGPLYLYLQDLGTHAGETVQQAGYSSIANQEPAAYLQDTWRATPRLTLNYGLRWEAQFFPPDVVQPSATAYGAYINNPAYPNFPTAGTLPDQTKEFQPRFGFNYDVLGTGKSSLRGSVGIFNARQNMLTEVGSITTNGVQQQTIYGCAGLTYPNDCPVPTTYSPIGASVQVFDKNYHNPRIVQFNVGFDQQIGSDLVAFVDFTDSKGVYLTRFENPNVSGPVALPGQACPGGMATSGNSDTVTYCGPSPYPNLGTITNTISDAKSLYRGLTVGIKKRMSYHFQFEAQYTYSVDKDTDSNERDPFTFRYANLFNLGAEYSVSDRDEPNKFNAFGLGELPWGFKANVRIQQHSAEPETDNTEGNGTGAPCSYQNSATRWVNGIDCGRNHLRKDNAFFVTDLGLARPFQFHEGKLGLEPRVEIFNAFNNVNNLNPSSEPALFDFNGFLRQGVGDPLQAQLALRFTF